ncbi:MAG: hypothetical protein AAGF81_17295 [Pseudomonadota bacterium]
MKTVAKPSTIRRIAPGALAALIALSASALAAETASPSHLRLIDRLDRPQDGYCVDILGTPGYLRPDLPLFAHNCKRGLTSDSAVVFTEEGQIHFPAVNLCITVAGVNSGALPGASVLLQGCGEATPFFETDKLQRFSLEKDGRLMLKGSDLCLAVGTRSATTYSSADVWRALFVDACDTADDQRVRWEFVVPR